MKRLMMATATLALAVTVSPGAFAQQHPDFTGQWANRWLTPLEKPAGLTDGLTVTPERAKAVVTQIRSMAKVIGEAANDPEAGDPDSTSLALVRGEYRTRQVIEPADGMIPYTPAGVAQATRVQANLFSQVLSGQGDGPEARLMWERCLAGMGQAPLMTTWIINMNRQIVQTSDSLVIWSEGGGEARIVRIGGKPLPANIRTFLGDSIGRWEGDTLVIVTTGMRADDAARIIIGARPLLVGPDSKVIERLSRVSTTELNYRFTIEDPKLYAKPWQAEYSMIASTVPVYEFACNEGNYALPNILRGARFGDELKAQKAAAAKAAAPPPVAPVKPAKP